MPHVTIDRDECISCANCWTVCPDAYEENPEDVKSQLVERFRTVGPGEGEIPDELADCVQLAADECPVSVITVA